MVQINDAITEVPIIKDAETEHPIPRAWRPVFHEIIKAFSNHDYQLKSGVAGVAPISDTLAKHIEDAVHSYGEKLIELPEETWNSSVCIWMDYKWDVFIDLWTLSEGRSDLILSAQVEEGQGGYIFRIHMVYVP